MTFNGRVTLSADEIKRLVAIAIGQQLKINIDTRDVWLGLVHAGGTTCEAHVTLQNRDISPGEVTALP